MVKVEPQFNRRSHTFEDSRGLHITIPAKKNAFIVFFLSLWLIGWVIAEIVGVTMLFIDKPGAPEKGFLLFWLGGWTVGGCFAFAILTWNLKSKEIISITGNALSIRWDVFGYGRTKEYDAAHIRDLRVSAPSFDPMNPRGALLFWGIGNGKIAFDYGMKTFRFAGSVDEAEAKDILQKIKERLRV